MSDPKRAKEEEDSSSDEEEDVLVEAEEINVEFEGFPLCDDDFDGIRQLLEQLLSDKSKIDISLLANVLISQNFIGTVLKQSLLPDESDDIDDSDVFGLVSCYSLTRAKDDLKSAVTSYLLEKCKGSAASNKDKEKFKKVLEAGTDDNFRKASTCIGFVINERFINVPPQAAVPMFDKLLEELKEAKTRDHKSRFDFTHYIILCKTSEGFHATTKEKSSEEFYLNAEEEFFNEEALTSFKFSLPSENEFSKTRRVLLLTNAGFNRSVTKIKSRM